MMRKFRILLLVLGAGVVGWLVWRANPADVIRTLAAPAWMLPLVAVPFLATYWLDTAGWRYAFPGKHPTPSFLRLFRLRLAGEAVNYITPLAGIGGEPLKAFWLKAEGVPARDAVTSVVVSRTFLALTQVVYILTGLGLALRHGTAGGRFVVGGLLVSAAVLAGVLGFILVQRKGIFQGMLGILRSLRIRVPYLEAREAALREIDATIGDYYRQGGRRMALSLLYHLAGWFTETLEAWLILTMMGVPAGLDQALGIQALTSIARAAAFFVPLGLGAQEGTTCVVFAGLGLSLAQGMAFSVLRRVREVVWMGIGWILLLREGSGGRPAG
ncbi:MAG: flippase-like domain-containing protein [Planctomycetota bacterium]